MPSLNSFNPQGIEKTLISQKIKVWQFENVGEGNDQLFFFFFNFSIYLFIYLFLAALGLHRCARSFPSFGEWGLLFAAVCGLLIAVASLVAEHGL